MRYQDLRVASRVVAKNPLPTVLSVVSIALGIGLTTAVFSAADALFLRPLPLHEPGEVLTVISRGDDGAVFMYGWPDYLDMRNSGAGFLDIAAYQLRGGMLANEEGSESVLVSPATPNFFSLLGVRAAFGRTTFEARDGRPGTVIGYRLWQRRFGGDPDIVGKTVVLSGKALTVTGVMPAEFGGLSRGVANDLWVSTDSWFDVFERANRQNRSDQFEFILRLKPGMSAEAAAAQLDASIRGPGKRKPAAASARGTVLTEEFAPGWRKELLVGGGLLVVLALVLFVACANVSQLRLAQAEARKKEIAVRMALGASVGHVLGQLLLETSLIAIPGAALGLGLAHLLLGKMTEFLTVGRTFLDPGVRLDLRVLVFTLAATLFSVLIAGLAPARLAARLSISEAIKTEQGMTSARTGWQKKVLIAGQAAVGVALFGIALLFMQSLRNATAIRPGFEPSKKLLVMDAMPTLKMPVTAWCEQVCERLAAVPGVRAATFARRLPLSESGGGAHARVEIPGQAPIAVHFNNVAGNYFAVMGTRILAGRGIDANDRQNTQLSIVVSETFARQLLPGRNPIGEWIVIKGMYANGKPRQVVGVAEDGPSNHLHEAPEPFIYFPYAQAPAEDITLMVETGSEPSTLARAINQAVKQFDPHATLTGTETLRQHMDAALSGDRLMATIASTLGLLSVALMAAGLFGVLQYAVTQRTRELGLRVALGATPGELQRLVLGEALRIVAVGIPIGLGLLAALAWFVRSMVLGVGVLNPMLYVASAITVLTITACSAWLPARRATRVEPMEALRAE
jgi:predicted permease